VRVEASTRYCLSRGLRPMAWTVGAASPIDAAMFQRLYHRLLTLADSPSAAYALAAIAFAESSFFPIPPDVILVPMSLSRPGRAWRYAALCTAASVAGGVLGYAIGALFYETAGKWLINLYGYGDRAEALRALYAQWGWLVILIKGLTPIPFKLVTIVSGFLHYNFVLFVVLTTLTRGARFFLLAGLLNRFGDPIRALLDRHFASFVLVITVTIVFGFWVAAKFL
jgi:membrane protein YqaA with SNARE-associated domain